MVKWMVARWPGLLGGDAAGSPIETDAAAGHRILRALHLTCIILLHPCCISSLSCLALCHWTPVNGLSIHIPDDPVASERALAPERHIFASVHGCLATTCLPVSGSDHPSATLGHLAHRLCIRSPALPLDLFSAAFLPPSQTRIKPQAQSPAQFHPSISAAVTLQVTPHFSWRTAISENNTMFNFNFVAD